VGFGEVAQKLVGQDRSLFFGGAPLCGLQKYLTAPRALPRHDNASGHAHRNELFHAESLRRRPLRLHDDGRMRNGGKRDPMVALTAERQEESLRRLRGEILLDTAILAHRQLEQGSKLHTAPIKGIYIFNSRIAGPLGRAVQSACRGFPMMRRYAPNDELVWLGLVERVT
jgi:hypothetical protein